MSDRGRINKKVQKQRQRQAKGSWLTNVSLSFSQYLVSTLFHDDAEDI